MSLVKLDDKTLVRLYIEGNEGAFESLLKRHQQKIYGYIFKMVRDSDLTEDIYQDTFIKVINTLKLGKYNEEGKFLPWVMRIAHNLIIDHFRKSNKMPIAGRKKTAGSDDDDDFDIFSVLNLSENTVEDNLIVEQIHNDVRELINHLPEEQRDIVILRHYKEMSFKDIAEKYDISINTALGRMRYALINLRKLIKEKNLTLTIE